MTTNYIKLDLGHDEKFFFFDSRVPANSLAAYQEAMAEKLAFDRRATLRGEKTDKAHKEGRLSVWKRTSGLPATLPEVGEYVPYVPTHPDAITE